MCEATISKCFRHLIGHYDYHEAYILTLFMLHILPIDEEIDLI